MRVDPRTPGLEIRLLGAFRVTAAGEAVDEHRWQRNKPQQLVKLLALQPHYRLHREQIADLLWPNLDLQAASNQLYKAVHAARRALEPDLAPRAESRFLTSHDQIIALAPRDGVIVDADEFERLARRALGHGDLTAGESALALYAGELLATDLYEEWVAPRRESLRVLSEQLGLYVAGCHSAESSRGRSVEILRDVLARSPANEEAHRLLMRIYAKAGHRTLAALQYRECEEALRRELDAEPDAETVALYVGLSAKIVRTRAPDAVEIETEAARDPVGIATERASSGGARRFAGPEPHRFGLRRQFAAAAAIVVLLHSILMLPGLPWSPNLRHRLDRILVKARTLVAEWESEEPRLMSMSGTLPTPGARVEALDSISGWATLADDAGQFTLLDVLWYPGASYSLVITDGTGPSKLITVSGPRDFPDGGVLDLGAVQENAGRTVDAHDLYGMNSVSYIDFDMRAGAYYAGVFDACTLGIASDADKLEAVNRFVAGRYVARELAWYRATPRATLERGSGSSGDLSLAMATIAYAGGYEVRLIDMVDTSQGRFAHRVVEVFYGNRWHLFDPSFGVSIVGSNGDVASYREVREHPDLVPVATYLEQERPGWNVARIPGLYASGIHHYYYFRDPTRSASSEQRTELGPSIRAL